METHGYVHKVLDPVTGETEKGFWSRRGLVITPVNTEKKLCIEFSGEEWSEKLGTLKEKQFVKVNFAAESTEYEDKWYTRLKGYALQQFNATD